MAYRSGISFGYGLTPWVQRLLIANGAVFIATSLFPALTLDLAFIPSLPVILTQPWRLITYMFAHGGLMHILFNMLALFFFGPPLEERWGSTAFAKFYFLCGMSGAILSFLVAPTGYIIGASAGVYGVGLAFAMIWPETPIYIWGIFPVKAKILLGFMIALSLSSAFSGRNDGVAHFAHLGGLAAAFLYLKWTQRRQRAALGGLRKRFAKQKLSVVPGTRDKRGSGEDPVAGPEQPDTEDEARFLDELDRVLDKISASGMSSLTAKERKLLDKASRRYRQN